MTKLDIFLYKSFKFFYSKSLKYRSKLIVLSPFPNYLYLWLKYCFPMLQNSVRPTPRSSPKRCIAMTRTCKCKYTFLILPLPHFSTYTGCSKKRGISKSGSVWSTVHLILKIENHIFVSWRETFLRGIRVPRHELSKFHINHLPVVFHPNNST